MIFRKKKEREESAWRRIEENEYEMHKRVWILSSRKRKKEQSIFRYLYLINKFVEIDKR